jgi:hypothetical protein
MRSAPAGIVIAAAIVIGFACGGRQNPDDSRPQEILALWGQIREWRVEMGWGAEPHPSTMIQMRKQTVKQAQSVCPDGHQVPKTCNDVCSVADAICDNAESICRIADDLATAWAQDKCTSAKASCREAKQRCCSCSETDSKASLQW